MLRRSNLYGTELRAVGSSYPPYYILTKPPSLPLRKYHGEMIYEVSGMISGIMPDLLELLEEKLNFTIVPLERKDGLWGSMVNGY